MQAATELLFVYGLLQPGQSLYHLLEHGVREVTTDARVQGFRMYAGSYPIAVEGEPSDVVRGTLLELERDEGMMREVDRSEAGYRRERVKVLTPAGEREAWMYVWPGEPWGETVEAGDFTAWEMRRR